jgi:hypothetical protein
MTAAQVHCQIWNWGEDTGFIVRDLIFGHLTIFDTIDPVREFTISCIEEPIKIPADRSRGGGREQ